MLVTFTRLAGARYAVDVVRDSGPPARLHVTSGTEQRVPHDLARFVVEREFGLKLGVFGQLAAGGDAGAFWAAPCDRSRLLAQRAHRLLIAGRAELGRSEQLVSLSIAVWEQRSGRRASAVGSPFPLAGAGIDGALLARAAVAVGDAALVWAGLGVGESTRLRWPGALTLGSQPDSAVPMTSAPGRRSASGRRGASGRRNARRPRLSWPPARSPGGVSGLRSA